jgi:NADPH2:quinone reductase
VQIDELPSPAVGQGQVRVRIAAAAVNMADVLLIANQYQVRVPTPFVAGSEFAGVVDAVGGAVNGIAHGDRVFGSAIVGAFAEEVVVSADALTPIPAGIEERVAAAFGVAHRTAFHVLRTVARLQRGEELVVLGAGGGVGLAAVQLGATLGASVTAVASSSEKLEMAGSHGASTLIDDPPRELREALRAAHPDGVDVVVDPVGGDLAEPALRALRWGGRFVTVGYASGSIPRIPLNLVMLKGIQIVGFEFRNFGVHMPDELRRDEDELLELFAAGRITPYIGASFGLEDVVAALRFVADRHAIGKVVLDIKGGF